MNLTLVLLVLHGFASQAIVVSRIKVDSSETQFTEAIKEKTKNLIEKTKRDFEMIAEEVQEIGNEVIKNLQHVIEEEKTKLTTIVAQTEDKELQLKGKEGVFKACSDTYKNELETLQKKAKDELTACIDAGVGPIKNFTKGLNKDDVRYKKFVEDELFKECATSDRNIALRCALEKIDEAAFDIKNIENEAIDAAYKCTVEANVNVARMVGKNGLTFQKCYADGLEN